MSSQRYGLNLRAVRKHGLHQNFICEGGGTGRRARLRCVWFILGGSNPLPRTRKIYEMSMKNRWFVDFLLSAPVGYCQILRDTVCFCRGWCSQNRSQKKRRPQQDFSGGSLWQKVVKIMKASHRLLNAERMTGFAGGIICPYPWYVPVGGHAIRPLFSAR